MDDDFFKSNKKFDARVFISYGEKENPAFVSIVSDFQRKIEDRKDPNLKLMNFSVENMGHAGAKASAYTQGLIWVWKDIKPD